MKSEIPVVRIRDGNSQEHRLLLRDVEQLITQFGDTADLVAAQLADTFFQSGDEVAGKRWVAIFKIVAALTGSGTTHQSEILPRYH